MSTRTTPSQTVGPFYSIGFSWLERTDLTQGAVEGTRVTVRGRVLDGDGQPVPEAVLEIWQADAKVDMLILRTPANWSEIHFLDLAVFRSMMRVNFASRPSNRAVLPERMV